MDLSIPADVQQRIDAQIATGVFSNADEVMREALDTLERRQRGLARLQAMIAVAEEDIAAGRVGVLDRDALERDVRNRLAERGITD
jgi:putative addiction module CopG family antidote